MTVRTEDEILADPDTEPEIRLRIIADILGRALFKGMRRHHRRLGYGDKSLPPFWDDLETIDRNGIWRPAIYDMMDEVNERLVRTGLFPQETTAMTYHSKRKYRAAAKGSRGVTKISKTPRITLHLPKADIAALRKFATMRREPVSSLMREAVTLWLASENTKNPFLEAAE